jgi:hypothetical protein
MALLSASARAEGSFLCRWQPGASAIHYAAFTAKEAAGTDVRVMMQGAALVAEDGSLPSFPPLTARQPAQTTAPLFCQGAELAPTDGALELTFSRRVSFGIEYTLGKCVLRYRCAPRAEAQELLPPAPLLTEPCSAPPVVAARR